MHKRQPRPAIKTLHLQVRLFFRKYPALPYLLKWLLISALIGVCVGSASAGFLKSLNYVTSYRDSHPWIIALLPVAGLIVGLLYYYYGKEIEPGNNLLIDTIHKPGPTIPFLMAPFIYLGTIVTHLFGGSAGREGTAIQMAGAIADQFSKPFRLSPIDRKTLIIAAIAAGFGSVFGTPMAGAIFGLEVFLAGRLNYYAIFPAFTAAICADLVTKCWQTPHTHYHITSVPPISGLHIMYALAAGVAFGLCAASFSKILHFTSSIFKSKIAFPPLRPVAGGLIVAVAVWTISSTKYIGLGIPTIVASFDQPLPAYDFAIKMAFTIVTLAAGFKGGEVTPLFFIGASLGNALSYFIPLPTGLLAGMGFVAVFAGATNTPLACTVMAMELFGSECGVYVALGCVVAYLFSGPNSIYRNQVIGEPKHKRFGNFTGRRFKDL